VPTDPTKQELLASHLLSITDMASIVNSNLRRSYCHKGLKVTRDFAETGVLEDGH